MALPNNINMAEPNNINMYRPNNIPLNNAHHQPAAYAKETKPDILRNLEQCANTEKNYEKTKIGDGSEKPLNVAPDIPEEVEKKEKYVRKRKIKRGLCFAAWIFCCPIMLVGLSRRESIDPDDDEEDAKDDPCNPIRYDPYYNRRDPSA